MQIMQTECSLCVDHNALTMHLVKFLGEGNETIEVKLATTPGEVIDDAALVARAKAVLVQVATFPDHSGNDDDLHDASPEPFPSSTSGERFRFVYRDGHETSEIPDVVLPDMNAARADAIRSATELLAEARLRMQEVKGWAVRVYNSENQMIINIDFDDVRERLDLDTLR